MNCILLCLVVCLGNLGFSCGLTNLALNKPAAQSSTGVFGRPQRAVDGGHDTSLNHCTRTAVIDFRPTRWWRVDLEGRYKIQNVVILSRGGLFGGNALKNFDVFVTEEKVSPSSSLPSPSQRCLHYTPALPSKQAVSLNCDQPVTGRYVTIVISTKLYPLRLCEVEVYGTPVDKVPVLPPTTEAPPPPPPTTKAPKPPHPKNWVNKACKKDSDCAAEHSTCFQQKCLCKPGLYYSEGTEKCLDSCKDSQLLSSYTVYPNSQLRKPKTGKELSLTAEECTKTCTEFDKKGKKCRSASRKSSGKRTKCYLHPVTAADDPKLFKTGTKGWNHYQRNCA